MASKKKAATAAKKTKDKPKAKRGRPVTKGEKNWRKSFAVSMPADLHADLGSLAEGEGISRNALCLRFIKEGMAGTNEAEERLAAVLELLEATLPKKSWAAVAKLAKR